MKINLACKYLVITTAVTVLTLIGCANVNTVSHEEPQTVVDPNSMLASNLQNTAMVVSQEYEPTGEYVLKVGDVLHIKFFYNSELNELLHVRPDGKISLQLIDEVKAAGLTPAELDGVLTEKYSVIFKDPEISVIVKEFGGQKIYVGGEVEAPKEISLVGDMSSLQAIFNAGGFRETAQTSNVIVISRGENNAPLINKVDLNKVISGDPQGRDVMLKPFDIVYVPKSNIANVNKFVRQYIDNIVPDFVSAGFSYIKYIDVGNGKTP